MPKKIVLSKIWLVSSSYAAVYPSISFANFTKYESTKEYSLQSGQFLLLVYLDTYGARQFPLIKSFYNISGNTINISLSEIHYSYQRSFYVDPAYVSGFKLIDDKEHELFFPWAVIKDGICELGFLVNSNYVELNGISF